MNEEMNTIEALKWISSHSKSKLIGATLLAILSVGFGMMPYFMVARISLVVISGTSSLQVIATAIIGILIGYTGKIVFHGLSTSLSHQGAYMILKRLRLLLAEKLYKIPLGHVIEKNSGFYKTIMVDTVECIEQPLAHIIPELISNLLVFVAMFIYIAILNLPAALLALGTLPISMIFYKVLMKQYRIHYQAFIKANNHMNGVIVEYINGIETIKAFNQNHTSYEKFTSAVENNRMSKIAFFKGTLLTYSAVMYIMPSTMLLVLPGLLYMYMKGLIELQKVLPIIILSYGLMSPLIGALNLTDGIAALKTTLDEVMKILQMPELHVSDQTRMPSSLDIFFDNVSFAYEKENVLKDLSFHVPTKAMTAIVGSSGSGKSTIAKLLMRFWDVEKGEIRIGNTSIKDMSLKEINTLISYVGQDNYLFDMTIKDNIRLGNKNASDEAVITAAKQASCHKFIEKLASGYESRVGDAGNKLSGGEKQRIAIARAVLKNSPIVLLDEATAFTDPENEVVIQSSIKDLVADKTLIVIAHRLSTIINADQIIVMDKGKILGVGKHDELMAESSHYNKLWHAHRFDQVIIQEEEAI